MLTLFFGFRPYSYLFVDMMNYYHWYFLKQGTPFVWNPDTDNILFDNIYEWLACNSYDPRIFFVLIATVYFGFMAAACIKLFPKDHFYAFVIYLGAFSTFSYGTNGIKAGAAASIFLLALAYRDHAVKMAALALLSLCFHHSMVVPIGGMIAAYLWKKPKWFFAFWLFCLLMAIAHVTFFQSLFAGYSDEQGARYLTSSGTDWGGKEGLRLDFILYSSVAVFVSWYTIFKKRIQSVEFNFISSIYLFTNGIWMLCMYANFTNRIAYLSWLMIPIVSAYPFFKLNIGQPPYALLNKIVLVYLAFFIYSVFLL
jgi:hypothetical protein